MAEVKNNEHILTNREPTVEEKRLLDVMIVPENRRKSVTDICKLAKISRTTYYNIFDKPEFIALKRKWEKKLISNKTTSIIHALIREAEMGSIQHIKMALEMDGSYTETTRQELTGANGGPIETKTDDDQFFANLRAQCKDEAEYLRLLKTLHAAQGKDE